MTRDEAYKFIDTVKTIQKSGGTLSDYFERDIASAIQSLIDSAVAREREWCAALAESAGPPAGFVGAGQAMEPDPGRIQLCRDIADAIRARS